VSELLEKIKNYEFIIWDWNGTILDDLKLCHSAINTLLEEYALPPLSLEKYLEITEFPVINYYKKLGWDFDKIPFKEVADKFMDLYYDGVKSSTLHNGVIDVIKNIHQKGRGQAILSAASQKHLDEITKHFKLSEYFSNIFGIEDHYAAGKLNRAHELIDKISVPLNKIVFIGDTDHDLHVGREFGIAVVLLAHGHQSYGRLANLHDNVLCGV